MRLFKAFGRYHMFRHTFPLSARDGESYIRLAGAPVGSTIVAVDIAAFALFFLLGILKGGFQVFHDTK